MEKRLKLQKSKRDPKPPISLLKIKGRIALSKKKRKSKYLRTWKNLSFDLDRMTPWRPYEQNKN
jgi:hypothetical protein